MLDFFPLIQIIRDEEYCIVKYNEIFPLYKPGQDLDIFCYDPQGFTQKILQWGNRYLSEDIKIKVTIKNSNKHIYVDLLENKKIYFRFDLYGTLPLYKKLLIKPSLFESVIENRQQKFNKSQADTSFFVPCKIDDLILRYLEFVEWYDIRPDKIKHLDFIINQLKDEEKKRFFDKLHHYTAIPETQSTQADAELFRQTRYIYKKLKGKSLFEIIVIIKRKLFVRN